MPERLKLYVLMMTFLTGIAGTMGAQHVDLLVERIAHYPFDNGASDLSPFGNHGLVNGPLPVVDRHGENGQAYSFDGFNDYILGGELAETLTSSVTVSCWMRTNTTQDYSHVVSKYNYIQDAGFILGTQEGLILWAGRVGSGLYIRMTSRTRIDDDRWHHVIGMIDGSVWTIYVDGVLDNILQIGYRRTNLDNNVPLTIGMYNMGDHGDHHFYSGKLDEVIIYRRPLNDCEIEFLFKGQSEIDR